MQNISLRSSATCMCRKQNFEIVFGFESAHSSLDFNFWLSLLPSSFTFLALLLFSFAGHLVGFIWVGSIFGKAFRILGLDERKGRWVLVEQDFHGNFQANVTWFFAFFSSVLDWIVLISVWFERSLHPAQVSRQSCPWLLKLMMPQVVKRTRIRTDGFVSFSSKRVKHLRICCKMSRKTHKHNQGTNKALTDTSKLFFKNRQKWSRTEKPFGHHSQSLTHNENHVTLLFASYN